MDNKQKLVVLSAFYEPYMSGAEQMVKEIVERLGGLHNITLITGRYDSKLPKHEKRATYELIRVGIGHKKIDKILYPFLAAFKTRSIKPDLAHAIMESYAGGALVILKLFFPRVKRILTLQCGDLDDPIRQSKFHIRTFWKIIHRAPHIITAISSALAKRAENLGVNKDKIYITHNGVDFSEVPVEAEKIPNRVICVARLSWEKAHQLILEAWVQIIKEISSAKLIFVGEGKERENIERQINDLGLHDTVTLTGNLPHDQVLIEIKNSEVFICPSLAEGLGNVFIEAQACGVPPIGTRIGGIPDVIQHEENGLLINPKSSTEIKQAILRLLKDKELAKRLGRRAKITSQKFNWDNFISQMKQIYKETLTK